MNAFFSLSARVCLLFGLFWVWIPAVQADSVVVFNEVMYHPAQKEDTEEWFELHNQNAVDVDLGGWRITGGVEYEFPTGALIPGGGYVVVAIEPKQLSLRPGVSNVFGPFSGRLSNGGEELVLWNIGNRRMDVLQYGVGGDWPSGADGGGVSLAKKSPNLATGNPANWSVSILPGGTPGYENFGTTRLTGKQVVALGFGQDWKYLDQGVAPAAAWYEVDADESGWLVGKALFQAGSSGLPFPAATSLTTGQSAYYFRTQFQWDQDPGLFEWKLRSVVDDGAIFYLNGEEVVRWNMPTGVVNVATPALAVVGNAVLSAPLVLKTNVVRRGLNVLAVEVHQKTALTNAGLRVAQSTGFKLSWDGVDGGFYDPGTDPRVPGNAALKSVGTEAFATSNPQLAERLNDGVYGSSRAWSPGLQDSNPGAGVRFGQVLAVTNVAWSRDNGNATEAECGGVCTDGSLRTYVLAYTLAANPSATLGTSSNPTNGWVTLATITYVSEQPGFTPHLRHRFQVSRADGSPVFATGLRIRTSGVLDELEVNTPGGSIHDAAFDAELSASEILSLPPRIQLNEVAVGSAADFWVELKNADSRTADLEGMILERSGGGSPTYVFPKRILGPGEIFLVGRATLGFGASAGQSLFLHAPARTFLLDSVVVGKAPQARNGAGAWLVPQPTTPGATNQFRLHQEIVIHEVMYRHRTVEQTNALDPRVTIPSSEEWVELYNRSGESVDLGGWQLSGAVEFQFPTGTLIPSGGYKVIARDAAGLRVKWPEIAGAILGNLTGRLGVDEEVRLLDGSGNQACSMKVVPKGWSNGDGASLELVNPNADTMSAESWEGSDESARTEWQEVKYRMVAGQRFGSSLWNEFRIGMLDLGEIWVDDVRVISDPDGARVDLIQNGDFEGTGTNVFWRWLGNHDRTAIEPEPGNPGNHVLKVRATSAARTGHNHVETTFVKNTKLVDGRPYEVSFRARWMGGCAQLQTLGYFQRLAKSTLLKQPARHGTPGAPNSVFRSKVGPRIVAAKHTPVMPRSNEVVRISAEVTDPEGVGSVMVYYRVNPAADFIGVGMDRGSGDGWVATLPEQGAGKVVQFFLEAMDGQGGVSHWPPAGRDSRALYQVADSQGTTLKAHELRLIQLNVDRDTMFRPTNLLSQARMGGTVIYDRQEVYYDVGVRLHGSAAGRARDGDDYISYDIEFPADHLFRGVQDNIAIDRSGRSPVVRQQDEVYVLHMFQQARLPVHHVDLCYFIAPRTIHTGTAILQLGGYNSLFMEEQLKVDGSVFNYDLTYEPSVTVNGKVESIKLPVPLQEHLGTDLTSLGPDKEQYRGPFNLRSGERADDYSGIMRMCQVGGMPQKDFDLNVESAWDVEEIMRVTALNILCGSGDQYLSATPSLPHNLRIFTPFGGGPVQFLPWDMDFVFLQDATGPILPTSTANISKLVGNPALRRRYLAQVYDLCQNVFNPDRMARWIQHYGSVVRQDYSPALTYIQTRRSAALTQLPREQAFEITTQGGNAFMTNAAVAVIAGRGWIDIREIRLEGSQVPLNVTWTSVTNWNVSLPLILGTNAIVLEAWGAEGQRLGIDSIAVTSTDVNGGLDTDGDGMPDVWERLFGYNPGAPNGAGDTDGDGMTNREEFLAGTDPLKAGSALRLEVSREAGRVALEVEAQPGRTYGVWERDGVGQGEWRLIERVDAGLSLRRVTVTVDQAIEASKGRFYRVTTPVE